MGKPKNGRRKKSGPTVLKPSLDATKREPQGVPAPGSPDAAALSEALAADKMVPRRPQNTPPPPKGIPDARKEDDLIRRHADGTLLRPDDIYAEALLEAAMKDPDELTNDEIIAIERTIRKSVAKSGGWRQNRPEDKIKKCKRLLKLLNRDPKDPKWDFQITVPNYTK